MLQAALLAAVLSSTSSESSVPAKTPIQMCFGAMDGAVYHGDPADKILLKSNLAACNAGAAQLERMRASSQEGPEQLFLIGRILDRAATLAYMGLGDARTALREITKANLYFRIATGLARESDDYRSAAMANVRLTQVQLQTLTAESTASAHSRSRATSGKVTAEADATIERQP